AHEAIEFASGLDEAGLREIGRHHRMLARELADTVGELRAERSARRAMQENYQRCLDVLGQRADERLRAASRGRARLPVGEMPRSCERTGNPILDLDVEEPPSA